MLPVLLACFWLPVLVIGLFFRGEGRRSGLPLAAIDRLAQDPSVQSEFRLSRSLHLVYTLLSPDGTTWDMGGAIAHHLQPHLDHDLYDLRHSVQTKCHLADMRTLSLDSSEFHVVLHHGPSQRMPGFGLALHYDRGRASHLSADDLATHCATILAHLPLARDAGLLAAARRSKAVEALKATAALVRTHRLAVPADLVAKVWRVLEDPSRAYELAESVYHDPRLHGTRYVPAEHKYAVLLPLLAPVLLPLVAATARAVRSRGKQ